MMSSTSVLTAQNIVARYGNAEAVSRAGLAVDKGSVTAIVGPNGAGKSTLLQALVGGLRIAEGEITLNGKSITRQSPTDRAKAGLVLVPQGRQVFPVLTVLENLQVMADALSLSHGRIDEAMQRFPVLRERQHVPAGSLSGGEQQMLALARALMSHPSVLLLDEPTLGLAPVIVAEIIKTVTELAADGVAVLIAEPSIRLIRNQIDRGYVMIRGQMVAEVQGAANLEQAYLEKMGMADHAHSSHSVHA